MGFGIQHVGISHVCDSCELAGPNIGWVDILLCHPLPSCGCIRINTQRQVLYFSLLCVDGDISYKSRLLQSFGRDRRCTTFATIEVAVSSIIIHSDSDIDLGQQQFTYLQPLSMQQIWQILQPWMLLQ